MHPRAEAAMLTTTNHLNPTHPHEQKATCDPTLKLVNEPRPTGCTLMPHSALDRWPAHALMFR